jgi:hypothetical protein
VRYDGWTEQWDETIPRDSPRMAPLGTRVPRWTVAVGSGNSVVFYWGDTSAIAGELLTSGGMVHQYYRFPVSPPSAICVFGQIQVLETPEVDIVVLFTKKELVPPWRPHCVLAYRTYDKKQSLTKFKNTMLPLPVKSAYSFRADDDNHTIDLVEDGQRSVLTFHLL